MSFSCQDHAQKLSKVSNATVCHHYILSISPFMSISKIHKDVMNTLNDNSFIEEIMGVDSKTSTSATKSLNCLFSAKALDRFSDVRVDTINTNIKYLGHNLVVYIDPGNL